MAPDRALKSAVAQGVDAALAASSWQWLGTLPFDQALAHNEAAVARVLAGAHGELLAFEPRAPVYTLGLRARTTEGQLELAPTLQTCANQGIAVREVDRGGLGTLHLPGQIVLFLALPCHRAGLRPLVARLLHAAADLAHELGVPAEVDLGDQVGVWTRAGKLASLGLYEAQGIVRHGLSLQVAIDRSQAQGLVLCGRDATRLASLDTLAPGTLPTLESLAERLCRTLREPPLAR